MTLWTYPELLGILRPSLPAPALARDGFSGVSFDIPCDPQAVYIPVREPASTQPKLIKEALASGAAAALTTAERQEFPADAPVIHVRSMDASVKRLAKDRRQRFGGSVVGVTGSVGKSSTKEIVSLVLAAFAPCHNTRTELNNSAGVARTLSATPLGAQYVVLEIAASGPGTLAPRASLARPNIGIVTSAEYSHGAKYSGQPDLLKEKLSLLDHLEGRRIGIVSSKVVEQDRGSANLLREKNLDDLIVVGSNEHDTVRLTDADVSGSALRASIVIRNRPYRIQMSAPGLHQAQNAAFAMAVAYALGLDLETAALACSKFDLLPRRSERLRVDVRGTGKMIELIDDAYNASPTSARALLALMRNRRPLRKVLVFGDMLELGPLEQELHMALADDVIAAGVDLLITVGSRAGCLANCLAHRLEVVSFRSAAEASDRLPSLLRAGDLVALKASYGMRFSRIVTELTGGMRHSRAAGSWIVEGEFNAGS